VLAASEKPEKSRNLVKSLVMTDLNDNSLVELSNDEKLATHGGWLVPLLIGAVIGAALSDWSGFKHGIVDGYNGQ
jgi:hypothetical protein